MTLHAGTDSGTGLGTDSGSVPKPGPRSRDGSSWRIPIALIALIVIPVTAGALRVLEVTGGPHLLPDNPRITASPAPLVIHVVAAAVFALVGALQFSARLRRRHRGWHRRAGRVLVPAGLLVAGSGLWMTLFYPDAPGGALLWTVRLVVGSAIAVSLVLGFSAIRRRDVAAHRAWMIRAYALSVAAGTQTVTEGIGQALLGHNDLSKFVGVTAGWVVNAAVAEWIIRRQRPAPRSAASPVRPVVNSTARRSGRRLPAVRRGALVDR
jgi:uncharacterized membrane protein